MNRLDPTDRLKFLLGSIMFEREIVAAQLEAAREQNAELEAKLAKHEAEKLA